MRLIRAGLEFCQRYHELYANPLILISMAALTRKLEGTAGEEEALYPGGRLPPPLPLASSPRGKAVGFIKSELAPE